MTRHWFDDFLGIVGSSLPLALVWMIGCIVALVTMRKHPGISWSALLGCLLMLLSGFGGSVLTWWAMEQRSAGTWSVPEMKLTLSLLNLVRVPIGMIGAALLVTSIFTGREPRFAPSRQERLEPMDALSAESPTGIRKPRT